jgi:hypothetical protein
VQISEHKNYLPQSRDVFAVAPVADTPRILPHTALAPGRKNLSYPLLRGNGRELEFGRSAVGNIAVRSDGSLMTGRQRATLEIVILGLIHMPCGWPRHDQTISHKADAGHRRLAVVLWRRWPYLWSLVRPGICFAPQKRDKHVDQRGGARTAEPQPLCASCRDYGSPGAQRIILW